MFHDLQHLFALAHRLVESCGRLLSMTLQTVAGTNDETARWVSPWDSGFERLHWAPVTGAVLAAASFVGFLLLVRYLQSSSRRHRDSYAPHLLPRPDLSAADIFVSVATALIGLAVCWATG